MFTGRVSELALLEDKYMSNKSELLVIYGRRRIGKTSLIKKFIENKDSVLTFEGIEGEQTGYQINNVAKKMINFTNDPYLNELSFRNWDSIFSYITERIINEKRKKKFILFFDELQWMACNRNRLIAIIKYYWDSWKDKNVMLILCGSIASFMVKKVISSKALYGRISTEILLKGLEPSEAIQIFKGKRSKEEILKYLLVFGGVPKYLEEINLNKSFNQNINAICFSSNSFMINEMQKIFYNQFKEGTTYIRIVNILKKSLLTQSEIAKKLNKRSGGSLKDFLINLENAEIIKGYNSFDKKWKKIYMKYKMTDEFLNFHFKYIEPNIELILESKRKNLFETLTGDSFSIWMGFAFERFCIKHALYIAEILGFADHVISYGPFFSKDRNSFQIDLIYKRVDKVINICEIKYHSEEIKTTIIPEFEKKLSLLTIPRGYSIEKILISIYGPGDQLRDSGYFNHYITIEDIFNDKIIK